MFQQCGAEAHLLTRDEFARMAIAVPRRGQPGFDIVLGATVLGFSYGSTPGEAIQAFHSEATRVAALRGLVVRSDARGLEDLHPRQSVPDQESPTRRLLAKLVGVLRRRDLSSRERGLVHAAQASLLQDDPLQSRSDRAIACLRGLVDAVDGHAARGLQLPDSLVAPMELARVILEADGTPTFTTFCAGLRHQGLGHVAELDAWSYYCAGITVHEVPFIQGTPKAIEARH